MKTLPEMRELADADKMTFRDKIKAIRKLAGVKTSLSWMELCALTDFDSFTTALAFGLSWNERCPNDRLVTMDEKYINMILFNIANFPKAKYAKLAGGE